MLFTDSFFPKKNRNYSFVRKPGLEFCIPTDVPLYACCESKDVENHSICLICRVPIDSMTVCYMPASVKRNISDRDYVYAFGIPIEYSRVKRKITYDQLRPGPIHCPIHPENRPSAILRKDGTVYCFHENRVVPFRSLSKR